MVVLNKIYTRTGDDGTTALGTGERRKKYDRRIAAYGTIDEFNAVIGVARLHTGATPPRSMPGCRASKTICSMLAPICAPRGKARVRRGAAHGYRNQVDLARSRDRPAQCRLVPLRSFVLPGGPLWRRICISPVPSAGAPSD